jgi:hypothetical protein
MCTHGVDADLHGEDDGKDVVERIQHAPHLVIL